MEQNARYSYHFLSSLYFYFLFYNIVLFFTTFYYSILFILFILILVGGEQPTSDPNLVLQGLSSFGAVHLSQFLSHNLGVPISPQVFYYENPSNAILHLLGDSMHILLISILCFFFDFLLHFLMYRNSPINRLAGRTTTSRNIRPCTPFFALRFGNCHVDFAHWRHRISRNFPSTRDPRAIYKCPYFLFGTRGGRETRKGNEGELHLEN